MNYANLDSNFTISLTVNDSSVRNKGDGAEVDPATTTINPVVSIVDVLPPILELKHLEGLSQIPEDAEIDSIHGFKNTEFPDPGFEFTIITGPRKILKTIITVAPILILFLLITPI